jgi:hypothetical protein
VLKFHFSTPERTDILLKAIENKFKPFVWYRQEEQFALPISLSVSG